MKLEEFVEKYFECVLKDDFSAFPLHSFFDVFEKTLYPKLALHGMLSFEDYLKCLDRYYNLEELKNFEYTSIHTKKTFTYESILHAVFYPRYKYFSKQNAKKKPMTDMRELYSKLKNRPKTYSELVALLDECIHCVHNSGFLLNFSNIEEVRMKYEEKVRQLSRDPCFGVLTRPAIEHAVKMLLSSFDAIFLDFNAIHELNQDKGYEWVNTTIRETFATFKFRNTDLVGRWFSGDEIVIITLTLDAEPLLNRFIEHCKNRNLSFKHQIFKNVKSFEELNKLISNRTLRGTQ